MMDMTWLSAIFVGAGCLALGYIFGTRYPGLLHFKAKTAIDTAIINGKKTRAKLPLEVEKLAEILEDFKMVLQPFTVHSIPLYISHYSVCFRPRITCFSYAGFGCEE